MMKKALITAIAIATTLICFSFSKGACKVHYNGIYAFKLDEEHSAVLRFYEDGTVLASTSVNDYMDVMKWFNKENKDMVLKGNYKIKKCTISFTVKGNSGGQDYEGEITGEKILFQVKNKDSQKGINRNYTFYALGSE